MQYSKERQKEHISHIRRILVVKPDSSILQVRDLLKKQKIPLSLDKDYINKLVNKIRNERAERINYYTLNKKIAEFEDKLNESDLRLWAIINSSNSTNIERISALREIRQNNKEMFDKMFDAGTFEKQLGKVKVESGLDEKDEELIKKAIAYATNNRAKDTERPEVQEGAGKK